MRLIHYAPKPRVLSRDRQYAQEVAFKPRGLWVSCEQNDKDRDGARDFASFNWFDFASENLNTEHLQYRYEVVLKCSANILTLPTVADMIEFTFEYKSVPYSYSGEGKALALGLWIDWKRVLEHQYQGIIIPIYHYNLRLCTETVWYYPWDCASGCIWDMTAIKSFTELEGRNDE